MTSMIWVTYGNGMEEIFIHTILLLDISRKYLLLLGLVWWDTDRVSLDTATWISRIFTFSNTELGRSTSLYVTKVISVAVHVDLMSYRGCWKMSNCRWHQSEAHPSNPGVNIISPAPLQSLRWCWARGEVVNFTRARSSHNLTFASNATHARQKFRKISNASLKTYTPRNKEIIPKLQERVFRDSQHYAIEEEDCSDRYRYP